MPITFSLLLLSMVASRDKALEIEGDLLEQRTQKGFVWFSWQVVLTCCYLALQLLRKDVGKLLLISYAIYELILKMNWMVLMKMKAYMHREVLHEVLSSGVSFGLFNGLVAFTLGMLVLRVSAQKGFLVLMLVCGMMLGRTGIVVGPGYMLEMVLFGVTPALLGALVMQRLHLLTADQPLATD